MKARKLDFLRVQHAIEKLCGRCAYYDENREQWRSVKNWVHDWHGVPHRQIQNAVYELVVWLNLRFPEGPPR